MTSTDKAKLWAATLIFLAIVYVASYAEVSAGVRFGVSVAGIVAALALVFFSQAGRMFSVFVREAGIELRKVVWPTKQETLQSVGVVFLFLLAMTFFLWFVDLIINFALSKLIT